MLATGFSNDWLDQTMSYQLIQTTAFAMHPRLVDYITIALVWMNCILRLVNFFLSPAGLLAPADLSSSADHDVVTDDIIIDGPLRCSSWFPLMFQLVHLPLLALAAGSYRSNWFTMLQLVQLGLRLIMNN
ncbi:hypothetical protein F511_17559 [Dorcoceras hygrometricum]|uniref:Uncharacterized protein n=1 Tax=Dorcoceras hygrometricum TaxID=472368 RepID=A0A2Z7C6V2_9LAMI|nr:hypothetical protein F511_17559 [Dorcoceras hygrometricum]